MDLHGGAAPCPGTALVDEIPGSDEGAVNIHIITGDRMERGGRGRGKAVRPALRAGCPVFVGCLVFVGCPAVPAIHLGQGEQRKVRVPVGQRQIGAGG